MPSVIDLSAIFFLVIVFIQDIKYRQISWWLIPVLALIFGMKATFSIDLNTMFYFSIINFFFFFLQLLLLTIYFSIKNKKYINIVNSYLGIGDILFIIVTCMAFSPVNFIFFYITGLIVTLAAMIIYNIKAKVTEKEIPLAGVMAILLAICLLYNRVKQLDFYNDQFLLTVFN